jgi:hypothetical protein
MSLDERPPIFDDDCENKTRNSVKETEIKMSQELSKLSSKRDEILKQEWLNSPATYPKLVDCDECGGSGKKPCVKDGACNNSDYIEEYVNVCERTNCPPCTDGKVWRPHKKGIMVECEGCNGDICHNVENCEDGYIYRQLTWAEIANMEKRITVPHFDLGGIPTGSTIDNAALTMDAIEYFEGKEVIERLIQSDSDREVE